MRPLTWRISRSLRIVTCDVWNCRAKSITRTRPSRCSCSRIARCRSSLSIRSSSLFGPSLDEQVFIELGRNFGLRAVYFPEIPVIHIVDDAVAAVLETAQLDRPIPLAGKERIIKFLVFADHMSLRTIEPDVVKPSE